MRSVLLRLALAVAHRAVLRARPRRQAGDPTDFSPDGTLLIYNVDPATSSDIWILTLPKAGGAAGSAAPSAVPFLKTNFSEGFGELSPDGRWIAYQSNESGRFEIYVRSFPDGAGTLAISADGGIEPLWSPSGSIHYRATNGMLMTAEVTLSPELRATSRACCSMRGATRMRSSSRPRASAC